jgi:hypothetical protein
MAVITALRGGIVLVAVLTLPGWFLLTFGELWRHWTGLQRWIVAIGLSVAFYPVLFYWMRLVLPFWTMGPYKTSALLGGFALVIAWRMRGHWRELFVFDRTEWLAIAVFGMTLFTRFWVIRGLPYPAWSDSLHHTLLTQLTAVQGRLPSSMEPFFPVALGDYHLGLYSITAIVEWLARVPAHTALLWTAQALNGLCGIGVYLVLDRKVGRTGAVVGATVVGLLSHQPAFYVNWGRFTQISGQAILLVAWLVTWEAIVLWKRLREERRTELIWHTLFAALLSGAVFLLHFRVALFYVPLLMMVVVWESWRARQDKTTDLLILGTFTVGLFALVVIAPVARGAVRGFIARQSNPPSLSPSAVRAILEQYFGFDWEAVPILAARTWLLVATVLAAAFGLLRRSSLVWIAVLWGIILYLVGDAYRLGIPLPMLTNLGAVLIMLYLPIGLIAGSATEALLALFGGQRRQTAIVLVSAFVVVAGFVSSHVRVTEIEPHRYFAKQEDMVAMAWIRDNTETDATFAVNTYFWLGSHPHGTDAGYWIPYFTGRRMTAAVMLLSLATQEYQSRVNEMSRAAERLTLDNSALDELQELGVEYIYIGANGDFSGPSLNAAQLSQSGKAALVYQTPHVSIFRIESPSSDEAQGRAGPPAWPVQLPPHRDGGSLQEVMG